MSPRCVDGRIEKRCNCRLLRATLARAAGGKLECRLRTGRAETRAPSAAGAGDDVVALARPDRGERLMGGARGRSSGLCTRVVARQGRSRGACASGRERVESLDGRAMDCDHGRGCLRVNRARKRGAFRRILWPPPSSLAPRPARAQGHLSRQRGDKCQGSRWKASCEARRPPRRPASRRARQPVLDCPHPPPPAREEPP
jgi:hypothetical protein